MKTQCWRLKEQISSKSNQNQKATLGLAHTYTDKVESDSEIVNEETEMTEKTQEATNGFVCCAISPAQQHKIDEMSREKV